VARAKWCGDEIYDAAAAFKERCLVRDDSLFAPGSAIWTPAHVRAAAERVGADLGSGSFIERLEGQLDGLEREGRPAVGLASGDTLGRLVDVGYRRGHDPDRT
jgi:hypothetical protein